jgi:hypothetical protein
LTSYQHIEKTGSLSKEFCCRFFSHQKLHMAIEVHQREAPAFSWDGAERAKSVWAFSFAKEGLIVDRFL